MQYTLRHVTIHSISECKQRRKKLIHRAIQAGNISISYMRTVKSSAAKLEQSPESNFIVSLMYNKHNFLCVTRVFYSEA